jgi:hypothetical protein
MVITISDKPIIRAIGAITSSANNRRIMPKISSIIWIIYVLAKRIPAM